MPMLRQCRSRVDRRPQRESRMKPFHHIVCAYLLFIPCFAFGQQDILQPNIIVVMSDDHAQWAMGAYGLEEINTPNLDWLASQGVLFTNATSPAPVCSPARASFYTGKMPSQHGVHDMLASEPKFDADWLSGETLLSERLKELGYRVALFGKWHASTFQNSGQPGFDRWLSYDDIGAGWQQTYNHSGTVRFSSDGEPLLYTGVQARFLTEEAIRFIDEEPDSPFFISLNLVEPHAPFSGLPMRLVAQYRAKSNKVVRAGGSSDLPDRGAYMRVPDDHTEQLAQYLAAISLIDEQIGRILDALQGRDLLRDTLLVYTSDHGLLMGQYGLYGKTNATSPSNFYEQTIRIPLIVYGPAGMIRPNQSRAEFVDLIDLHTTVMDYATGGRTPTSEYGPGRSMRILFEGERNVAWRTAQFAEHRNARMISDGHWKLVRYFQRNREQAPKDFWYDLAHPLGERHVSDPPRPAVQNRLITEMEVFFAKYETPEHTARRFWDQPPPNPGSIRTLDNNPPHR